MVRGAAPGAPLLVADIYGADPAGGNALALVRALAWLAGQRVRVVAMSLAGPANALVQRAVAAAQARGMYIVAAVGNDGRAAPPAYPASYPGVIAVTGIDGRGRVLIEAGRALHLDYAAPAADMAAAGGRGLIAVRGTTYAVPFVAGRLARHIGSRNPLAALDAEARRGRGVGRGVICADCRTVPPAR
jgi:subtilisin family serine protease